ncbi:SGNH/GDSL hydrolase family protein [Streptomyces sp. NPDC002514]|uniref:SGNH/GDSL hydrolase family protein n=1 Tax=Streptomyces sp. NPDC001270 TaxID=3364554 RepID=UPI0036842196
MTRRSGYVLLSAVVALVVGLFAALWAGVAADDGLPRAAVASHRPHHGPTAAAPASAGTWVATWSAAPAGAEPGTETLGMAGRSVRNVVHTSVSGGSARITLSNLYGRSALILTHASIAVAAADGSATAAAGTMRQLTFGDGTGVVIPPGGQVLSDAVRLAVPRDADILVTTYSPSASGPVTCHPQARQLSYLAQGDRTEDPTAAPYTGRTSVWRYLTAVDVLSNESDGTVVVLGDSLTDGVTATESADHRWTDFLGRRLREAVENGGDVPRYSVVNEGISGNQVLADGFGRPADNQSGLDRFERDVLDRTNVKIVVIDLGVNDILRNPRLADPGKIVDGLRALVGRAHAHGLKVVGATLMPFAGHRGSTPARELVRQEINARIRAGGVFDAVVDFDAALRDPADPGRLRPAYDSGDHLHPDDRGYRAMAEVFDLRDLKGAGRAAL